MPTWGLPTAHLLLHPDAARGQINAEGVAIDVLPSERLQLHEGAGLPEAQHAVQLI